MVRPGAFGKTLNTIAFWFVAALGWTAALGALVVIAEAAMGRMSVRTAFVSAGFLLAVVAVAIAPKIIVRFLMRPDMSPVGPSQPTGSYRALFYLRSPRVLSRERTARGHLGLEGTGLRIQTDSQPMQILDFASLSDIGVETVGKPLDRFPVLSWLSGSTRWRARLWDSNGRQLSAERLDALARELFDRTGAGQ